MLYVVVSFWGVCIYKLLNHEQAVALGYIFKWKTTGLDSEFSSLLRGCLTKVKELSPFYYLPIADGSGEIKWIHPFPKGISTK